MPVIRSESGENAPTLANPVYLAGLIVVVVLVVGVAAWLGLRVYRKRMAAKRREKTDAAFLSVKGIVRDDAGNGEKGLQRSTSQTSMDMEVPSITFPDKALGPPSTPTTREEVLNFHRRTGSIPTAFSANKPMLGLNPAFSFNSQLSADSPSNIRKSWLDKLRHDSQSPPVVRPRSPRRDTHSFG